MNDCCALPPFSTHCHCGLCHVTFATLDSFEAHLIRAPKSPVVSGCKPPASLGLVDDNGVWRTPEGLKMAQAKAVRLAALPRRPRREPQDA